MLLQFVGSNRFYVRSPIRIATILDSSASSES